MATDATGTPTTLGIPTYNPAVDAPSGLGFNAAMAVIDTLLQARTPNSVLTTAGDIIYASAGATPARLGIGSTGQVLTVAGGLPVWQAAAFPSGMLVMHAATSAPSGWLICDGTGYSTSTYANLFAAIGYQFGGSSGTFNVPDLRGRMPAGYAASGGHSDVATLGNNDGQAESIRRPRHGHSVVQPTINISDPSHSHGAGSLTGTLNQNPYTEQGGGGGGPTDNSSQNVDNSPTVSITGNTAGAYTGISASATGGTVGPGGGMVDTSGFIVVNFIIKT